MSGALLLVAAGAAQAAGAPRAAAAAEASIPRSLPPGQTPPPAELQALDYFRGTWICTGVVEPSAAGPAHLTKGKITYKWDMAGFFESVVSQDERTKDDPVPRVARGYLGYEPASKEYSLALFYLGGGRLVATSPTWTADALKFVGESTRGGERLHVEQLVTRKSDTEYLSTVDGVGADGKATKLFHEKCVKTDKLFGRSH